MKAETGLFSSNPPNLVNSCILLKDSIEDVCRAILTLRISELKTYLEDQNYRCKGVKEDIDYNKKRWSKDYRNQDLELDKDQVLDILKRGFDIELEQADKTNIIKTIKESLPSQSSSMVR